MISCFINSSVFIRCKQIKKTFTCHAEIPFYICSLQYSRCYIMETYEITNSSSTHDFSFPIYYKWGVKTVIINLSLYSWEWHPMVGSNNYDCIIKHVLLFKYFYCFSYMFVMPFNFNSIIKKITFYYIIIR